MTRSLPIELRIPNPDGSLHDVAALVAHLRGRRVARIVAYDAPPIGVVLAALDDGFARERDDGIYVTLGSDHTLAPALHALATASGVAPGGPMLAGEGAAARAALIDLADDVGRLVLVDQLAPQHAEWQATVASIARYSRHARWIFVERVDAEPDDPTALMVATESASRDPSELDDAARALLEAVQLAGRIAVARLPIDLRQRASELVSHGWLHDSDGMLWTQVRGLAATPAAARLLVAHGTARDLLAAGPILIASGAETELLDGIGEQRDELIAIGSGLAAWDLLDALPGDAPRRLQLAIAARIQSQRALEGTRPVEDPTAADRFNYAQILIGTNKVTDAIHETERALAEQQGDIDDDDVRFFLAQCHMASSNHAQAKRLLEAMESDEPTIRFRRDALTAGALLADGADISALLDDLMTRVRELDGPHVGPGRLDLARALHLTGRIRDAMTVLDSHGITRFLYGRTEHDYLLALLWAEGGRIKDALTLLDRVSRGVDLLDSFGGQHMLLLRAALLSECGDLDTAEGLLTDLVRHTKHIEYRDLHSAAQMHLATVRLRRDGIELDLPPVTDIDRRHGAGLAALHQQVGLRRGDLDPADVNTDGTRALVAMLQGDASIVDELDAKFDTYYRLGSLRRACSAAHDVALVALSGADARAGALVERWARVAAEAGRISDVTFAAFLTRATAGDLTLEDAFAALTHPAHEIGRELTAPGSTNDRLAVRLAEAVRHALRWTVVRRRDGQPWWIDQRHQRVWHGGGSYDLSTSAVRWSLVHTLCEHPAGCTKADLISAVWGIDDHHPLEDENRLRMAVYKLRQQLEDVNSQLIETTETGYRIGPGALAVRVAPSSSAQTSE